MTLLEIVLGCSSHDFNDRQSCMWGHWALIKDKLSVDDVRKTADTLSRAIQESYGFASDEITVRSEIICFMLENQS